MKGWFKTLYNLDQNKTPIFDSLMKYVNNNTVPFHVPGHKKGIGIPEEFKNFIGENAFKIDVTVFKSVDSLHHPTSSIKKAEELVADAYNSDYSFFCINGTTIAIQAMIMSAVSSGDKILIPRNVHKSITAGIILSGAIPVYMNPDIDEFLSISHGIPFNTVKKSLENNPDVKAVLLINPTYYGVSTDIKKIASLVHSYNIPLLIDEAHGPHLIFNNKLPICAMDAGADICAQSTHKITSSLTQGSFLHVKSKYIEPSKVRQNLNLLQTTSPSYIILASLDCTRKQLVFNGKELLDKSIELANYAREEINKIDSLYCFGEELKNDGGFFTFDPTKITINCRKLGISGYELEKRLASKYKIQLEMADAYNALAAGSFGDTKESIDKLITALKDIRANTEKKDTNKFNITIPEIPKQVYSPRKAFQSNKKSIPLKKSVDQISAEFLLAYPPGIPVLCPGEIITQEIVDYIEYIKSIGLFVQGTEDPKIENIKIID